MSNKMVKELLDSARDLIEAAYKMVDGEQTESTEAIQKVPEVERPKEKLDYEFQVKPVESKTPVWSKNMFDEMQDLDIEKPEGYETINDNIKPTNRSRKSYTPITVKCSACDKKVSINPIFKKDIFVCDKCIGKRIGRGG